MKELVKIVAELKAPKNRRNNYGNYNYRSCEDILEAVKPLLAKHNCALLLSDDVVTIGGANYIKATAMLFNSEGKITQATAYAREETNKKGMEAPQMTGTASSYARKYALNGLFCIDDTKDADANEYRKESDKRAQQTATPQPQAVAQTQTEPTSTKKVLTLQQVKENEEAFLSWLYGSYQCDPAMSVSDKIAGYYECDYATTCYLSDKFEQYLQIK